MSKEKPKEPMVSPVGLLEGLRQSEKKDLVDFLMEKRGVKPATKVERAWNNVQELKRDDAE